MTYGLEKLFVDITKLLKKSDMALLAKFILDKEFLTKKTIKIRICNYCIL